MQKKEIRKMSGTIKENVQAFAVKQVLKYFDEDPEKSLPKILILANSRI
jgi:hypothetical protein